MLTFRSNTEQLERSHKKTHVLPVVAGLSLITAILLSDVMTEHAETVQQRDDRNNAVGKERFEHYLSEGIHSAKEKIFIALKGGPIPDGLKARDLEGLTEADIESVTDTALRCLFLSYSEAYFGHYTHLLCARDIDDALMDRMGRPTALPALAFARYKWRLAQEERLQDIPYSQTLIDLARYFKNKSEVPMK